jgi:hypothetical protein
MRIRRDRDVRTGPFRPALSLYIARGRCCDVGADRPTKKPHGSRQSARGSRGFPCDLPCVRGGARFATRVRGSSSLVCVCAESSCAGCDHSTVWRRAEPEAAAHELAVGRADAAKLQVRRLGVFPMREPSGADRADRKPACDRRILNRLGLAAEVPTVRPARSPPLPIAQSDQRYEDEAAAP